MTLDRDSIRRGFVREIVAEAERLGLYRALTDEERAASRRAILAGRRPGEAVWVFGYGSLMWNPAFRYAEKRVGTVHGWHRSYRLWTPVGRGSPERPGLMLALDRGGSCRGIVFRIAEHQVEEELEVIWAREMLGGAYRPFWAAVRTEAGPVRAITFAIRRDHPRYTGKLPVETIAARIATAAGRLGTCREYLVNTVAQLETLGIERGAMHDLLRRVEAECLKQASPAAEDAAKPNTLAPRAAAAPETD